MNVVKRTAEFIDLSRLFDPRSIAVVGASEQPGNLGGVAIALMQKFGYRGALWPVNPNRATVHGLPCFTSLGALPAAADLVVIATGADRAIEAVRQAAAAGTRFGIIWAGGYQEVGEDGASRQAALVSACRETGFTLVGPNCIGIINARSAMVASFASFLVESEALLSGNIAMISQSGGLATMAQAMAQLKGCGFGLTVSSGNEAMLTVADYIHAAALDDGTKVIAAYVEGIRDGDRFVEAVRAARDAGKPVVVLKGGRTSASVQAVAAHTGALAGEQRVWEAVAAELGIISVGSLEELLDVGLLLAGMDLSQLPKGKSVAIVTFGGGSGVISADQCAIRGLKVPRFARETLASLAPLVPPIASVGNPVDLTPQVFNHERWFASFSEALDTIAADPGVDIVFCQFGPMAQRGAETAREISRLRERTDKTVLVAWPLAPNGIPEILADEGVHIFQEYERAIAAIARIAEVSGTEPVTPSATRSGDPFDWSRFVAAPRAATVISENECHRILAAAGVPVARGVLARSPEEAVQAARNIGFPLAVKGISASVTHRAAAGLLALGIRSEAELVATCARLREKADREAIALEGLYVQEMVADGIEIIIAAFRDPVFGVMTSCGAGGVLTELVDDFTVCRGPLDARAARRLLERLRIVRAAGKLDAGARIEDLAGFLADFSHAASSTPWRKFVIELNPVKWTSDGVKAVDGLIIIDEP